MSEKLSMNLQVQVNCESQNQNRYAKKETNEDKRRRQEREHESLFEMVLLTDTKLNIFSRVPAESVLTHRSVCKSWGTLLSRPDFLQMHLRHQLSRPDYEINGGGRGVGLGLLFTIWFKNANKKGNTSQLYYGDYDDQQYSFKTLRKINHPPMNKPTYTVVGSCNGLVCFALADYVFFHGAEYIPFKYDPVYICNPITREYLKLPLFEKPIHGYMVGGFGYHRSLEEYKIVRIFYSRSDRPSMGQVQVYTLGSGSGWRNKADTKHKMRCSPFALGGVLANGALHWLDREMKIVAFDLKNEEFHEVTPPPGLILPIDDDENNPNFHLRELGGCLCIVHQQTGKYIHIWSLKKTAELSTTTCNMKEQEYRHSLTWSKEFTIPWLYITNLNYKQEPFAITKSGEVLLWWNRKFLEL